MNLQRLCYGLWNVQGFVTSPSINYAQTCTVILLPTRLWTGETESNKCFYFLFFNTNFQCCAPVPTCTRCLISFWLTPFWQLFQRLPCQPVNWNDRTVTYAVVGRFHVRTAPPFKVLWFDRSDGTEPIERLSNRYHKAVKNSSKTLFIQLATVPTIALQTSFAHSLLIKIVPNIALIPANASKIYLFAKP